MVLVFPGFCEVNARFFRSISMLIREDLPTLDRPTKANSGSWGLGRFAISVELLTNSVLVICMKRQNLSQNNKNVPAMAWNFAESSSVFYECPVSLTNSLGSIISWME